MKDNLPRHRPILPEGTPLERLVSGLRKWVSLPHSERVLIGIGFACSYIILIMYTAFLAFIELSKMRRPPKSAWIAILVAILAWMWSRDQQYEGKAN